jgi:lipid-A-disaccharide synthase
MVEKMFNVYFVLGEESGDRLASDLVPALRALAQQSDEEVRFSGLAGSRLKEMGFTSLFDIDDIAVMGITAVLARLPLIIRRVRQTVADILSTKPDVVVLIDSPDFCHAVAKRVRKHLPDTPIINYICPSVWAWRSSRAGKMRSYIDHVLAILPFEPETLKELNGPPATYIGHPLAGQIAALPVRETVQAPELPVLLVLPGSRRGELKRMLELYGRTLQVLRERGVHFHAVMPAVTHLKKMLEEQTANWPVKPQIVDSRDNLATFAGARAALATSGTVALELALHHVPMVTGYRIDPAWRLLSGLVTTWSAILPNLILDRILVPEEHNEMVIPQRMARYLERLMLDGPERQIQLDGFKELSERMKTTRPPGDLAAEIIFDHGHK